MTNWKLKNKKTGKILSRVFKTRDEARFYAWNHLDNNYQSIYMVFKPSSTKPSNKKMGKQLLTYGTKESFIMNTKPILKKVRFGTPVHKAKPVHRSY